MDRAYHGPFGSMRYSVQVRVAGSVFFFFFWGGGGGLGFKTLVAVEIRTRVFQRQELSKAQRTARILISPESRRQEERLGFG